MGAEQLSALERATAEAWSTPLSELDVSRADRFASNTHWPFFARLRKDNPVHYCADSAHGAYWSITKFHDIVAIDSNHQVFSSQNNIVIGDNPPEFTPPMFIAADPPVHDMQRKAASPAVSPARLADLEALIRERVASFSTDCRAARPSTGSIGLHRTHHADAGHIVRFPVGRPPSSALLVRHDDVVGDRGQHHHHHGAPPGNPDGMPWLFHEALARAPAAAPKFDFISLLAHDPATKDMVANPLNIWAISCC